MKETLAPGIEHEATFTVTPDMSPPHLPVVVLATPIMIGLIENTCLKSVESHLDEGETTVGTHVCVSHTGAAREGEEVRVTTRLAKVERRRLTFEIEVHAPAGRISDGTHQRAVIDTARFRSG
ncbi:MAG TPA: thioesterase family protein [Acidimicrobiia bacterium]|jgi:fluoroacetyl-CoA thioesterase